MSEQEMVLVSTSVSYKQTTASSIHGAIWEYYSVLAGLGARRTQESKTSIRHRINPTTMVASTTPLEKLDVAPKTKDDTDLVVPELGDMSFVFGRGRAPKLTISGLSPALSARCLIVWKKS